MRIQLRFSKNNYAGKRIFQNIFYFFLPSTNDSNSSFIFSGDLMGGGGGGGGVTFVNSHISI